jgi:hypothetical protein
VGDDQRFKLVEFRVHLFVASKPQHSLQVVDDGPESAVYVIRRALEANCLHALGPEPLAQRAQDAAFANPGLTR